MVARKDHRRIPRNHLPPARRARSFGVVLCLACLLVRVSRQRVVVVLALQPFKTKTNTVQGLPIHKAYLRQQQQDASPYCLALNSILDLPSKSNFLATQVWPSARVASKALEDRTPDLWELITTTTENNQVFTICELGCGPGLPSLTVAAAAARFTNKLPARVIATDLDDFGLQLVEAAAKEQGLDHILSTRQLDLIELGNRDPKRPTTTSTSQSDDSFEWIEDVDLFVMSDVFESEAVAMATGKFTQRLLSSKEKTQRLWVFAQTDRAQREVYLRELQTQEPSLKWSSPESYSIEDRLWLCDVDETKVNYG